MERWQRVMGGEEREPRKEQTVKGQTHARVGLERWVRRESQREGVVYTCVRLIEEGWRPEGEFGKVVSVSGARA